MCGFLLSLLVANYLLWYSERSTKTKTLATVERPTSAKPPEPPAPRVSPRSDALKELHSRLSSISRGHAGTHGVVVFDPASSKSASLNADRTFVAASLSKMYALLTLYKAAAEGDVRLEEEITMRPSDVWAYGTGVLHERPAGHTMTLRECAKILILT